MTVHPLRSALLATLPLSLFAVPLTAHAAASGHETGLEDIIVTAAPYARARGDVLQNTTIVDAEALDRAVRASIGETLAGQAGVGATSFGPGASRPVLRGLQGDRIRTLSDGIGSIDAASTSVDHAVSIDPLVADRIEVVRGPATLQFGSAALGGVVNVITRRVPQAEPPRPLVAGARAGYAFAANERFAAGAIDARLGSGLVAHADASRFVSGDLDIPGFAESRRLRALEAESGEAHADDQVRKRLPNSDVRSTSGGAGLSWIGERGHLGVAVSRYETNYGIPGSTIVATLLGVEEEHEDEEDHEEEGGHGHGHADVRIDLEQTRVDAGGALSFEGGLFESLRGRFGYADYRHLEVEDDGSIGTRFDSTGWEGRLDLIQRAVGGWRGALGVQALNRRLTAAGEEAFVPPNRTRQWGAFAFQEWKRGRWRLEGAARIERTQVKAASLGVSRGFTSVGASLGAAHEIADGWFAGVTASRAVRAPSAEELFSSGPHVATGTFEVGDPALRTEKGLGLEASLKGGRGPVTLELSLFWNQFDDFIIETPTGSVVDDLPEFRIQQTDARTWGAELSASAKLVRAGDWTIVGDLVADLTRGRDRTAGTPLARMPQARARFGMEAQSPFIDARIELEVVGKQTRVPVYELPTDGYEMLNAALTLRPFGADRDVAVLVQLNNLTNVDARRSTSFLKDTVPLAARDLRLSLMAGF